MSNDRIDEARRLIQALSDSRRQNAHPDPHNAELSEILLCEQRAYAQAAAEFSRPYRERIAELEKELAITNDIYTDEREERGMYQARVVELEKRLSDVGLILGNGGAKLDSRVNDALAMLNGDKTPQSAPLTVDGETPGQVFGEAFRDGFGKRVVKDPDKELVRINGELRRDYKREQELDWANAMEIGAQAVLRAFGPVLAKRAAAEALRRIRARLKDRAEGVEESLAFYYHLEPIISAEIASLEATDPAFDHVHELGSCSFCDRLTSRYRCPSCKDTGRRGPLDSPCSCGQDPARR